MAIAETAKREQSTYLLRYYIVLDTCCVLEELPLLRQLNKFVRRPTSEQYFAHLTVIVPLSLMRELDGLKVRIAPSVMIKSHSDETLKKKKKERGN